MEPAAHQAFNGPAETYEVAAVSIAISLKRIADALTSQPGPENLYDMVNDIRHNGRPVPR